MAVLRESTINNVKLDIMRVTYVGKVHIPVIKSYTGSALIFNLRFDAIVIGGEINDTCAVVHQDAI